MINFPFIFHNLFFTYKNVRVYYTTYLFLLTTSVLSVKQRGNVIHCEEELACKPFLFVTNSIRLFVYQYTIHNADQNLSIVISQ